MEETTLQFIAKMIIELTPDENWIGMSASDFERLVKIREGKEKIGSDDIRADVLEVIARGLYGNFR